MARFLAAFLLNPLWHFWLAIVLAIILFFGGAKFGSRFGFEAFQQAPKLRPNLGWCPKCTQQKQVVPPKSADPSVYRSDQRVRPVTGGGLPPPLTPLLPVFFWRNLGDF